MSFELLFVGKELCVARIDSEERSYLVGDFEERGVRFRPIRTPEQIAAEERDAAIKEMFDSIHPGTRQVAIVNNAYGYLKDACRDIYDAGYRKQEAP